MNKIQLTPSHKSKLLEMCNVLFPKDNIILTKQNSIRFGYINHISHESWSIKPCIHWFEFCITHLINDISFKNTKSDILADCEYEQYRLKYLMEIFRDKINSEYIHPIDYLYSEFIKLNLKLKLEE